MLLYMFFLVCDKEVTSFACPVHNIDSAQSLDKLSINLFNSFILFYLNFLSIVNILVNIGSIKIFSIVFLPRFLEDRSSPQCRFRDQQFLTAIKVLLSYKFFLKNTCVLYTVSVRSYICPGSCCLFRVVSCLYQLLGNMGKWDSLLPESVLKELMLDKLLNRYLMITLCSQTLQGNAVCACRKVFTFIIFNVECMYFW